MANKYIKFFIRQKKNFETTLFLSEKYYDIKEKYFNIKYNDDVDDDKSKQLEYELKHYNKLLCSSIHNDYHILNLLSDETSVQYKNKKGYKSLYIRLEKLMNKDIFFDDGKITVKDFISRNRIRLNHPDNPNNEINYIDFYNSIISYNIYDYLCEIVKIEDKILKKIEHEIGKEKIASVINNEKSKEIINNNYFKSINEIIVELLNNLKNTEILPEDLVNVDTRVKEMITKESEQQLLNNDMNRKDKLYKLVDYLNSLIKKYSLMSKAKSSDISNEDYLLKMIFNNDSHVVENMLVELSEIMTKLMNDINKSKEKMLNNLYGKSRLINDTTIKGNG